jgi:iron(III) transport system substrate-binding protein
LFSVVLLPVGGCDDGPRRGDVVVLYTSVDEPVARPVLEEFTRRTGIRVETRTDTEANKSAGLAARLEAEKDNPKGDVWWGNEVFRTIRLADAGVLAAYESPSAKDVAPSYRDPQHRWAGSGLRVRVIGVSTSLPLTKDDPPWRSSIEELTRPELKDRVAIANPRFGTTSGHVAALYVLWGDEKAKTYFRALHANGAKILGGNGDVATELARGTVWLGLTDNDDVDNVNRQLDPNRPSNAFRAVRPILPDQDSYGTLAIPCTVSLVAGAQNPDAAKKLIDYLLSAEVEKRLIEAKFAAHSVRAGAGGLKPMQVDYREVAKVLDRAANEAHAILSGRETK